jgi:LysM repeat protein
MDGASAIPQQLVTPVTCPHLGMRDDPAAHYAYPSRGNICLHCRQPATPLLEHQEAYCLHEVHKDCPVYWQPRKKAFPRSLQAASIVRPRAPAAWIVVAAVLMGLGAIGFGASQFLAANVRGRPLVPMTGASPSVATDAPSLTAAPSSTPSPVPTSTAAPTGTALPPPRSLETRFELGGTTLLMHRVRAGDMFETLDSEFDTTAEVLRRLNYSLTGPLLANTVIVIAPGIRVVDPALPSFMVRKVDLAGATLGNLATRYHVEAAALAQYNRCTSECTFSAGEWILVPVMRSPTATP